jgi:AraC-like DNA-binding protein
MTDHDLTSDAAKALAALGASKGGKARAMSMTAEQRSQSARAAVEARWQKAGKTPLPRATHKGSFREDFGIDVDCYVLNDEGRTAVISQRGMGEALGLGKGGSRLPSFVKGEKIAPYIGRELSEKLQNPLVFQGQPLGANIAPQTIYGYDVTILIDICKAVGKAESEGKLLDRQKHIARQAHIIVNASAKAGIKGLVYALAGYDATREETIAAFKLYVREEARDYEKEFPDQLYAEWYRLYNLPKPERNKPWKFKHLTVDQVYRPLARSNGKILQLTQAQRKKTNSRWKRLHEFLSEIGVKALRNHLGQLLGIARISKTRHQYESHFNTLFGEQLEMSLQEETKSTES